MKALISSSLSLNGLLSDPFVLVHVLHQQRDGHWLVACFRDDNEALAYDGDGPFDKGGYWTFCRKVGRAVPSTSTLITNTPYYYQSCKFIPIILDFVYFY